MRARAQVKALEKLELATPAQVPVALGVCDSYGAKVPEGFRK